MGRIWSRPRVWASAAHGPSNDGSVDGEVGSGPSSPAVVVEAPVVEVVVETDVPGAVTLVDVSPPPSSEEPELQPASRRATATHAARRAVGTGRGERGETAIPADSRTAVRRYRGPP